MFPRILLAIALAGAMAPRLASADAGDDQYKVAAGHYARSRWQLSIEEFQNLLGDYPDHPKAEQSAFFLAEALLQVDQLADARTQFRAFFEKHPESRFARQARFRAGEASYLLDELDIAKQELEAFRAKHPDDALDSFALPYLGEIALASDDFPLALQLFQQGLQRFPEGAMQDDCRFGLARALDKTGQSEEAQRLYLAVASKAASPLADDAQFHLGALEYEQADYESALATFESFETTFKESPFKPRARLGRGWCLFQTGRYDKARAFFEALRKNPEVATEAGYWLGLTYKAEKNWPLAAETLAGLTVEAGDELAPAVAFHLGEALVRSGKETEAAASFARVLAEWPASPWADDSLLASAQMGLAAGDHAAVDERIGRLLTDHPASPLATEA